VTVPATRDEHAQRLAPLLGLLMLAFALRVLGQLVVATTAPAWLPPMAAWHSALLPYPLLVAAQLAILAFGVTTTLQFARGTGPLVRRRPRLGRGALVFGLVYAAAMLVRYALRMAWLPDERWLGGTIPIAFHLVLASFVLSFAWHHRRSW
jgi:hypothetical protein